MGDHFAISSIMTFLDALASLRARVDIKFLAFFSVAHPDMEMPVKCTLNYSIIFSVLFI